MRISISVTNYSWPGDPRQLGPELAWLVRTADGAGVDTVWVSDHLVQADPTAESGQTEMLEAYTTLGFIAAQTERVRLGTMVTAVTYRPPALLIKAVTTLDVLSSGRAWLGVGARYHDDEARAMGLPLPAVPERFARLEETLQIATRMWAGDDTPFEGKHYQQARPHGSPLPAQRPRPSILIGGTGTRRTLRLVAQYADACNLFDIPDGGAPCDATSMSSPATARISGVPTRPSRRHSAPASTWGRPVKSSSAGARQPRRSGSNTSS